MTVIILTTLLSLILSFIADRNKTLAGVKRGAAMFIKILPTLLSVIIIVSIILYLTPESFLLKYFGQESVMGYVFAAAIGAVTLIPGFIAYPVCGYLVQNGVSYPVIAVFITTLLMVGFMTIPIESRYFGLRVTLLRNGLSLIGALIIGLLIGWIW